MSIPLRTDFRVKYPLRESVQINEEFLEERLHSFDWQKRVAYEVSRKFLPFLSTLKEGVSQNYIFPVETKNPEIKQIILSAHKTIGFSSSGQFIEFNTKDKSAKIELSVVKSDCINNNDMLIRKFASIIGHELSHVGTIVSKYNNDVTDFRNAEQYELLSQVIHNTVNYKTALEKEIYEYAYSLYCTSDLEITAFISQTEFELRKLAGKDILTVEDVKKYIRFTEPYQAFSLAKEVALHVLNKTKYNKEWFVEQLKQYGLNIENIDKQMKHLEYRADYALEKCMANAMNTTGDY